MARLTFGWYPNVDSSHSVKPSVGTAKFGDGYESRFPIGINTQSMKWAVTFTREPTEGKAILNFLRARNGVEAFDWTNPLNELGIYICREWSAKQLLNGHMEVTATFEQTFE